MFPQVPVPFTHDCISYYVDQEIWIKFLIWCNFWSFLFDQLCNIFIRFGLYNIWTLSITEHIHLMSKCVTGAFRLVLKMLLRPLILVSPTGGLFVTTATTNPVLCNLIIQDRNSFSVVKFWNCYLIKKNPHAYFRLLLRVWVNFGPFCFNQIVNTCIMFWI